MGKKTVGGCEHLIEIQRNFMTGYGFLTVRIDSAGSFLSIGRIGDNDVCRGMEFLIRQQIDILINNTDLVFKPVVQDILPGICRQFRLGLDAGDLHRRKSARQDQRYDPASAADIYNMGCGLNTDVGSEQKRINGVAVSIFRLMDDNA